MSLALCLVNGVDNSVYINLFDIHMGDHSIARPLSTQDNRENNRYTAMSKAGLKSATVML
jgi:hypothetical protein